MVRPRGGWGLVLGLSPEQLGADSASQWLEGSGGCIQKQEAVDKGVRAFRRIHDGGGDGGDDDPKP